MEILETLKKNGKALYPEDLDFFETELATGGSYKANYRSECLRLIRQIRKWQNGEEEKKDEKDEEGIPSVLQVDPKLLAPDGQGPEATLSPAEKFFRDVSKLREGSSYKSSFKKLMEETDLVDALFIEKHFSFFEEWELNAILSVKQLGEPFLEKYFGALDHDKIARYQHFSEAFFMKHYAQMDATVVLQRGKNEWRKKENRSKQLDVFLRLKGVKI